MPTQLLVLSCPPQNTGTPLSPSPADHVPVPAWESSSPQSPQRPRNAFSGLKPPDLFFPRND